MLQISIADKSSTVTLVSASSLLKVLLNSKFLSVGEAAILDCAIDSAVFFASVANEFKAPGSTWLYVSTPFFIVL